MTKIFLTLAMIGMTMTAQAEKYDLVKMETAYGDVYINLYEEIAPKTVAAFKERVSEGFYDGHYFHRVIPGFVAQGGDPELVGKERVDYTLPAEFTDEKQHIEGAVAMARLGHDINSASTQFYITLDDQPHLDGQYTIFGQVVKGMGAVQQILKGDTMDKLTYLGETDTIE